MYTFKILGVLNGFLRHCLLVFLYTMLHFIDGSPGVVVKFNKVPVIACVYFECAEFS